MYDLSVYDKEFYRLNQYEGIGISEWLVPALIKTFDPKTVVDVGCGTGHLVKEFNKHPSIKACGLEGSNAALLLAMTASIQYADLRRPLEIVDRADIAISFEVAEHIDQEYVEVYVENLCKLSNMVVITAAIPGQGGEHHVNEQYADYWMAKFAKQNYLLSARKTIKLIEQKGKAKLDGKFVPGYMDVTNFMVFEKGW